MDGSAPISRSSAWRETLDDLREEQYLRVAAEDRLKRLVAAGIVGPEWAAPGGGLPPLPPARPSAADAPAPQPPARELPKVAKAPRRVPSIRLL